MVCRVRGRLCGCAFFLIFFTACSSQPRLYHWGAYEPLVYQTYRTGDGGDPAQQALLIEEDIEKARAEGQRVAPGVHAHLGFLYYSQGETLRAREEFLREKELFPEASTFIDGIIDRMEKNASKGRY